MRVSELGEFGLIDKLAGLIDKKGNKKAGSWQNLLVPIGDDAAAWKSRSGTELITTDILVEDIHFDFSYTGWRDLGWKSIAINISDIYAMGGKPQYALVSLALPGSHRVSDVLAMYEGMIEICNKYGITLAGGNISASKKVVVNVTLTGVAGKDIMTRSAARPGDLIAVFGHPGLSAAGLKALTSRKKINEADMKVLRDAHLHPAPGLDSGPRLAACGVKAAIDTSDGLLSDLGHICEASCAGAVIYEQNLPVHRLLRKYFNQEYLELILTGGEDYQLLFTALPETMDAVIKAMKPAPAVIGEIISGQPGTITVLDARGKKLAFNRQGWDHYKRPSGHG
ncbi:MAG: thiamine-phosphate kinase [Dehalococcoidia bacterium]|jgi:thiamine-monophosphate kinase